MADYADHVQVIGTEVVPSDGTVLERAESGKPRLRSFYTQTRYDITLVHEVYTAEKDVIVAFWEAHKTSTFTIDFQGDTPFTTYSVRFVGPPRCTPIEGDGRFRVTLTLVTV